MLPLPELEKRLAVERAWQSRLLRSYEMGLEAHVAHVFAAMGKRAAHAYRADGQARMLDELLHLPPALTRVVRPSLIATARAFGDRITQLPHHRKAFGDLDAAIVDFMDEHTAEFVVGVSETTRAAIVNAIQRGTAENLSVEDIANLIVDVTSGEIGLARARRIARTETHAAAMYGQQAAAEASTLDFTKTWLATEDHRTRPDHAEANGQTVGLDEMFDVGGVQMRYPGDVDAPPHLIINCRCVALYSPVEKPMRRGLQDDVPYTSPEPGRDEGDPFPPL